MASANLIGLQNRFLGHGNTVYDLLSQVRREKGAISNDDIARIAREHHLPPQHVRTVAKFYDEFAVETTARHTVKFCDGQACEVAGARSVEETVRKRINSANGNPSARLGHVTCLGFCGKGPNALMDGVPVSFRDASAVEQTVATLLDDRPLALEEPTNAVYPSESKRANILLRPHPVTTFVAARAAGVYAALEKAVTTMTPEQVRSEILTSQLRGRGGAGFPTGLKYKTVAETASADGRKFVVVNADEGDAGAYVDKELLERDPHTQIEGALLAAFACGAQEVVFYVRYEYPRAYNVLERAISEATEAGLVGQTVFNSSFACSVRLVRGQGAYICGEETSLLRSIEGLPPLVSVRPPFPAQKGLWGCPTAVNNVETIHNLPWIVAHGGSAYAELGYGRSRGTKLVSLNTRVRRPGLYEVELGTPIREILFELAGGMANGQRFKGVQIGGPLGSILPETLLDTPLAFEELAKVGAILGHGGMVVYSDDDDLVHIARGLMRFCAIESCGKCFPCRIGSVRGVELFDQMIESGVTDQRLALLAELCETMKFGSLCALGGMIPKPIESLVQHFPAELERYRKT
jgi:NADH:ubiquinone oxidoreductase subunit F (NADH-binding)/NADH:ubiquinone oxidoreductase subunit E